MLYNVVASWLPNCAAISELQLRWGHARSTRKNSQGEQGFWSFEGQSSGTVIYPEDQEVSIQSCGLGCAPLWLRDLDPQTRKLEVFQNMS